jgi:hypothetical protein
MNDTDKKRLELMMEKFTKISESEKRYVEGYIQAVVEIKTSNADKKMTA